MFDSVVHEPRQRDLNDLPASWTTATLGDLFDAQQGASMSAKRRKGENPQPFLRTLNVLWGHIDLSTVDQMDFTSSEMGRLALRRGDLLVCEGGDIGRTAMWRDDLEGCLYQNHLHRLRARRDDVEPEFFMFWMQAAITLLGMYGGHGNKTTIPNLSRSRLLSFEVPLPPLHEQRTIAHVLRSVQQAVGAAKAVIAATRELKRSLLHHLFTYGPVPVADADQVPLKETEVGQLREHWIVQPLGEIATIASGGTPSRKVAAYWNGDIPWVKTGEVDYATITSTEEFITARGLDESSARMFPSGTLLMAMYGQGITRGRVAVLGIDAAINQACAAITPDARACTQYLYHLFTFHYDRIRNLGHGANQKNLSALLLKSVPVPLPPISEQRRIVNALDAVDRKIEVEEQRKTALEATFTSLLHQLMTGKVRVADLDTAVVATGGA